MDYIKTRIKKHSPDVGFFILSATIAILAAIISLDFSHKDQVLVAGEIAPLDITADRSFFFADSRATREKKEKVRQMQPLVCDLY